MGHGIAFYSTISTTESKYLAKAQEKSLLVILRAMHDVVCDVTTEKLLNTCNMLKHKSSVGMRVPENPKQSV